MSGWSTDGLDGDHPLPKSEGGRTTYENGAAACQRCNSNRKSKPLHEFLLESQTVHPINKVDPIFSLAI